MPKRVRDASRAVAPRAEDGDTKLSAYAKLLSHCGRIKPADRPSPAELAGAEEDADETVAPKASHTLGESASAEAAVEERAAADEPADNPDEDEEEANDEDDDERPWRSDAYDAHYGGEWPAAELDAQRAARNEARWELPGLGDATALVVPGAAPPGPPARTADASLKQCGILPALRGRWREAHGDGPLSAAQSSLLGLLSGHVDVLCPHTPMRSYAELLPVLAIHAAQHMVVTQKMLQRHQKKGLTPQDRGFTRASVLVMLPFRSHALAFVEALLALLPACYEQVENKARFVKEFSEEEGVTPMPVRLHTPSPVRRLRGAPCACRTGSCPRSPCRTGRRASPPLTRVAVSTRTSISTRSPRSCPPCTGVQTRGLSRSV